MQLVHHHSRNRKSHRGARSQTQVSEDACSLDCEENKAYMESRYISSIFHLVTELHTKAMQIVETKSRQDNICLQLRMKCRTQYVPVVGMFSTAAETQQHILRMDIIVT